MGVDVSDIELKACPFCGSAAEICVTDVDRNGDSWTKIDCVNEDCSIASVMVYDDANRKRGAIDLWNTRAPQWQPIESAPKDGDILAWDGDDIRVTHWHTRPSGAGGWYEQVDQYEVFFWSPTHWQPLPAPPEERP